MPARIYLIIFFSAVFLWKNTTLSAQETRTQYPPFLKNAYTGVNIGYINYSFSEKQLEPGYQAAEVRVPHAAVRVILYGRRFNKYLSAQISYMRPVGWVEYNNINGDEKSHKVGMNVAGLTIRPQLPLSKKISLYAEAGLGVITRGGFIIDGNVVVKDANYGSVLFGGGLEYHLENRWALLLGTTWSPSNERSKQPATIFYSMGFNYTMRPLSKEIVERNAGSRYIFPKNVLQLGYSTNGLGYGINNFVSKKVPIFWGGNAQLRRGVTLHYQRNIFHTRKVFSFDLGASASWWQSDINKNEFFTAAMFPQFRFTVMRSKPVDVYFNYSLAGPAYISKTSIDGKNTGKHFTFQDFMGMGGFMGKKRKLNAELRIAHYSNGNIFPFNEGVKVPMTFNLGWAF
jgi:hypothetical protein